MAIGSGLYALYSQDYSCKLTEMEQLAMNKICKTLLIIIFWTGILFTNYIKWVFALVIASPGGAACI